MELTIAVLKKIGFEELPNQEKKTFYRKSDNIFLYEFIEPNWFVKLDEAVLDYSNLMRVDTEEALQKAISNRFIK